MLLTLILSVNPFFLPSSLVSGSTCVSEPDSELSARSDIPERSFLRGIRISYEIVLDAAWHVPRFLGTTHQIEHHSFGTILGLAMIKQALISYSVREWFKLDHLSRVLLLWIKSRYPFVPTKTIRRRYVDMLS